MTKNRDFKARVRERMVKTGERYTAARAQLLAKSADTPDTGAVPNLFAGYRCAGGVCRDTGAARNFLAQAGLIAKHNGEPISEAMLAGLGGGVGFLYAVFEYKGLPPMLSVLARHETMSDTFVFGALSRSGAGLDVSETGSAAAAAKALEAAIADSRPALAVADVVVLADESGKSPMQGFAPTVVAVAGVEGDDLLIDEGGLAPRRLTRERFARARGARKQAKNRLATVSDRGAKLDLRGAVYEAVAATIERYFKSPWKAFASNVGFAGLEKWQTLMTDPKDKKGWPRLFADGRAPLALRRTFQGIEHEFTPPAAGRPMYARFLEEAGEVTGNRAFGAAAKTFDAAGERWRAASNFIASCGVPSVESGCELLDRYSEWLDDPRVGEGGQFSRLYAPPTEAEPIEPEAALKLFGELADHVGGIIAAEREAVAALQKAADGA
ncbi:MAG: DUF4872 domain-containing protein [Phycisphaerales bacterium]|nr:DUF4872 domain-containing protein [Phycisphaerales bacterium]